MTSEEREPLITLLIVIGSDQSSAFGISDFNSVGNF